MGTSGTVGPTTGSRSYLQRLDPVGPKRLLAIDGGGIRGVIALEVLDRLQRDLRASSGDDDLVLADVFEYIGGTSTGAIIAACLAMGMSTDRILDLYATRGAQMFYKATLRNRLRHTYCEEALGAVLRDELGETTTFGSDRLRTLLLIVVRNASTDSPWPLSNNPYAKFNDRARPDCPLDVPLWQLVRASTAAPLYFAPETIMLGGSEHIFVDGGVTPFNNPAFQLFTMATLDAYGLGWPTGEDNLLVVSVGTGNSEASRPDLAVTDMNMVHHATSLPGALMISTATQQDALCRMLGRCRFGVPVDSELGDLSDTMGLADKPLFSYVRYDLPLHRQALDDLGFSSVQLRDIRALDRVEHLDTMRQIGRVVADRIVSLDHFDGFLGT